MTLSDKLPVPSVDARCRDTKCLHRDSTYRMIGSFEMAAASHRHGRPMMRAPNTPLVCR